jgi:CheY-like chemotaxis protein
MLAGRPGEEHPMTDDNPQPGTSLLLIEDDELLRGAMKMVLEWEGYHVACAGNGREALDLLRAGPRPSCILLDLMLPVLDGWTFRHKQKRDPALADIPVVVVSATDPTGWPDAARHVQKPFQPAELLAAIRAVAVN